MDKLPPDPGLPQDTSDRLKEFDIAKSVHLLRADLARGEVRESTWERVYNEELSYVAECLDAPLVTSFRYVFDGDDLVAPGISLGDMHRSGEEAARQAAESDRRHEFSYRRAMHDSRQGVRLIDMMHGSASNVLVEFAPFAEEAAQEHGTAFIEEKGYNAKRRLGFVRIYHKVSPDQLELTSISFDNSDLEVFAKVADKLGLHMPEGTISDDFLGYAAQFLIADEDVPLLQRDIINIYDTALSDKTGRSHRQGREAGHDRHEAWSFIENQQDLVGYFLDGIEKLARGWQAGDELVKAKKEHTYSFWSALKLRMEAGQEYELSGFILAQQRRSIHEEMEYAKQVALEKFGAMVGCGGAIELEELLKAGVGEVADAIFGNANKKFDGKCVKCPFCGKTVDAKVTPTTIACPPKKEGGCGRRVKRG